MAYWNMNWSNVTGVYELIKNVNDVTNETLVSGIILAIFFVMLLYLKRYEFKDAMISASWVTALISLFAWLGHLLSVYYVIVFFALTGIFVLTKYTQRD